MVKKGNVQILNGTRASDQYGRSTRYSTIRSVIIRFCRSKTSFLNHSQLYYSQRTHKLIFSVYNRTTWIIRKQICFDYNNKNKFFHVIPGLKNKECLKCRTLYTMSEYNRHLHKELSTITRSITFLLDFASSGGMKKSAVII